MSSRARRVRRKNCIQLQLETLEDRTVPTLLGQDLFPADNPWNQKITDAPVAANSDAVMQNLISHYGDWGLHPDFGEDYHNDHDLYGIPFNVVHGNSVSHQSVVIDDYADESDLTATPIPANVVLENDHQNGPRDGVANRSDSHMLIWDVDNDIAYEFFHTSRPSENGDGKWHAAQETVWDMKTNAFRTIGWTSADAAGLSILAGLVRPDEALPVSEGGQGIVTHAIRFTLQNSIILNDFLYPASHNANNGNTNTAVMPPMGARFRLKADVDISQFYPESRIIAQAMKDYGLIVADNGSNFFFQGASSSVDASNNLTLTWNDDDIQSQTHGMKSLSYSDFEMVDLTPVVTGINTHQANPGTQVTITGKNFSGAAGHLKVLFGSTPATSFTMVDDSHLKAVVPNGTGTVDVRVQSGVATNNSNNYTGTIFGYGVSAVNAADQFTFGGGGTTTNQAPTVATAASASPSPVQSGKQTTLKVLGADDAGEANLKYTWTVILKPAGQAFPTFSVNESNAAKTTVATFPKVGNYAFRVTMTDAAGLSVTSDVNVKVTGKLTSIKLLPNVSNVLVGSTTQFTATACDQFGNALVTQPKFTWSLNGRGTLAQTAKYVAPTRTGTATISASTGGVKASLTVNIVKSLPTSV